MNISAILNCGSAVSAIIAAILWFMSAKIKTPNHFGIYVVKPDGVMGEPLGDPLGGKYIGHAYSSDLELLGNNLIRQSKLSAWAAIAAGISAVTQAGHIIFI